MDDTMDTGKTIKYSTLRVSTETLGILAECGFVDAEEAMRQVYELMWETIPDDPIIAGCYWNEQFDMFHPTLLLDEAKALIL